MTKFCRACGNRLPEDAKFCDVCGNAQPVLSSGRSEAGETDDFAARAPTNSTNSAYRRIDSPSLRTQSQTILTAPTYVQQESGFQFLQLFSFAGRVGRLYFWMSMLSCLGLAAIAGALVDDEDVSTGRAVIALFLYFVVFVFGLATQVKRWHDRNKSGRWVLICLIPIIGLWALIENGFLGSDLGPNQYGEASSGSPFTDRPT